MAGTPGKGRFGPQIKCSRAFPGPQRLSGLSGFAVGRTTSCCEKPLDLGLEILSVVGLAKESAPGIEVAKPSVGSVREDTGLVEDGNGGAMIVADLLNAGPVEVCRANVGDDRVGRVQAEDPDRVIEGRG